MRLQNFDLKQKNSLQLFFILIMFTGGFFVIDSEFFTKTYNFNGEEMIDNCEEYGHIPNWNYCGDHKSVKDSYIQENIEDSFYDGDTFFMNLSYYTFGTYTTFSFISAMLLIVVSYFLAIKITGKNYSGLIVAILIIQSAIFTKYALGVTYPFHWALFYVSSIYFLYRFPILSPLFFILSVWAKPLSILYLPINFTIIYLVHSKGYKLLNFNFIAYSMIFIGSMVYLFGQVGVGRFTFDYNEFYNILIGGMALFISDLLNLSLFFASLVGLILLRKEKTAKLFMFIFFIFVGSIIITDTFIPVGNDNEEYRMIIFIVFIGIATSYVMTKFEKLYEIIKK